MGEAGRVLATRVGKAGETGRQGGRWAAEGMAAMAWVQVAVERRGRQGGRQAAVVVAVGTERTAGI